MTRLKAPPPVNPPRKLGPHPHGKLHRFCCMADPRPSSQGPARRQTPRNKNCRTVSVTSSSALLHAFVGWDMRTPRYWTPVTTGPQWCVCKYASRAHDRVTRAFGQRAAGRPIYILAPSLARLYGETDGGSERTLPSSEADRKRYIWKLFGIILRCFFLLAYFTP